MIGQTTAALRARRLTCLTLIGAASTALALTACGSTTKSSASDSRASTAPSAGGAACVAAADAFLKPYTTPQTTLGPGFTPLTKRPAPGSMIFLGGIVPRDQASFASLQDAGKVIGWSVKEITFNGTVEDLNSKLEQAISDKPTVIMVAGHEVASIPKPLADAKRAGIVVAMESITDVPKSYPGFASVDNGPAAYTLRGEINAYEFMRASNCKGSAAIVTLAGFPTLTVAVGAFESTIASKCPACKASVVTLQPADVGTPAATTAIVSELQSNPSIKYVYGVIADEITGLSTAISQAGLSGITVFGALPDQAQVADLQSGDKTWWVSDGDPISSWVRVDAALQAIETHKPVNRTSFPIVVYTPGNIGSGQTAPADPPNYQQLFRQLWHINS